MKLIALALALASITLGSWQPAAAEDSLPPRLSRPASAPQPTIGNLLVEQYSSFGKSMSESDDKAWTLSLWRPIICDGALMSRLTSLIVGDILKRTSKRNRDLLKHRDQESLNEFSMQVIADFDNVSSASIRADEARGPGVYHNAIKGLGFGLEACGFFGQERKL